MADVPGRMDGELSVQAPFNLEATVRVLQRRSSNRVDLWENDSYVRVLTIDRGLVLVKVWNCGSIDAPGLRYSILTGPRSLAARAALEQTLIRVLGLDLDPAVLLRLPENDPMLRVTVHSLRGMRPPRFTDLFESFASVIPFQQLSLDAGISILGKFVDRFGEHVSYRGRRYSAFPNAGTISAADVEELQSCGLSLKKSQSLVHIARTIHAGQLDERMLSRMQTSEAMEALVKVPGVGPWTAGLVLLRGLGRIDVFPSGDAGAARGLRSLLKLDPTSDVDEVAQRFGEHRGCLYFCCLGASLLAKGSIRSAHSADT
jgi:DNA-3-methyladenine glycosylase II